MRLTDNIEHEKTWTRLQKGNIKRKTESLPIAAQNNAIRIMLKPESIIYNRKASVGYPEKDMKRLIT